jgi:hypothetical protein
LQNSINSFEDCKVFTQTSSTEIRINKNGEFLIHLSNGKIIQCEHLILACGASARSVLHDNFLFSKNIKLNPFATKSILSDELIQEKFDFLLHEKIDTDTKIVILGSSHSAFSAADYLLTHFPKIQKENSIRIIGNQKPKLFFNNADEAIEAGYRDFEETDICPVTNRVYRLAGLRMSGRKLYASILGLCGFEKENRVQLTLATDPSIDLECELQNADLIIQALGYTFNMPKISTTKGNDIQFAGAITGHWVNEKSQVLSSNGSVIPGLYLTGLASGYIPGSEAGGETSFKGQTNGIWYYQNIIGAMIIEDILLSKTKTKKVA